MILAFALLPVLAFGPVLGGATVWLHSHGTSGAHVHFFSSEVDVADAGVLHEWHDAQHEGEHADGLHDEHEPREPAPEGTVIELAPMLASVSSSSSVQCTARIAQPVDLPAPPWRATPVMITHRVGLCRAAWPPQRAARSGVAALLQSSHALLI